MADILPDPVRIADRTTASRRLLGCGAVLLAVGVLCWVLSRAAAGGEAHAFAPGQAPPRDVHLVAGHTYRLAIPGGVAAAQRSDVDPKSLACRAQRTTGQAEALKLTAEASDTKATDTVASFIAPYTGAAHLTCDGLAEVYVEGVGSDPSGLLLLLATIALTLGAPLLLSGLRVRAASRGDVARVHPAAERPLEFAGDGEAHVIRARPRDDLDAER